MFKVYSFDVFDTTLIRRVAVPSDVFRIIGIRVARETANVSAREMVEDFFSARIEAERLAREAAGAGECTLASIWTILRSMLPGLPGTCGPEYELAAERSVIAANRQVAARIAGLRASGARIIFASDTYLPGEFIQAELIRHRLARRGGCMLRVERCWSNQGVRQSLQVYTAAGEDRGGRDAPLWR